MFEYWMETDLQALPVVKQLTGRVFSLDDDANKIGVSVTNGGEPVTLTGTVKGYVVKPDNTMVEITGDKSENKAWIVLPDTAYTVVGKLSIILKLIDDTVISTLGAVEAYCMKSR